MYRPLVPSEKTTRSALLTAALIIAASLALTYLLVVTCSKP